MVELLADQSAADSQLLQGSLLIAKLDNPDIDVDAYVGRVDAMAAEIREDDDLRGQTTVQILARVINNLIGVASQTQDGESLHRYCGALIAVRPESIEARMLRSQVRAVTDRRSGAIEDLDWLIDQNLPGLDRDLAIRLRESLLPQESPK